LTTSFLTCTALERTLTRSYLGQGCYLIDGVSVPATFIRVWECPWRKREVFAVSIDPLKELEEFCLMRTDTCRLGALDVNVGFYRSRHYPDEECGGGT
jgi:hypothetical protein